MELEGFKSAWRNHGDARSAPAHVSRPVQFARTSAMRDLQRSDELARVVFSALFSLVALAVAFLVLPSGATRIGAALFAAALIVDGAAGLILLRRRKRGSSTATMREFILREHRQVEGRMRVEGFVRALIVAAAVLALIALLIFPTAPSSPRANALDALARMAILTAFLAFVWRRAKSRSGEVRRELEHYVKELQS